MMNIACPEEIMDEEDILEADKLEKERLENRTIGKIRKRKKRKY